MTARPLVRRLLGAAPLLLICATFTWAARRAFPIWDDGWLWLLLDEKGTGALAAAFADRPLNARLWGLLAASGERSFWAAALASQALLWPGLGALAAGLWSLLYPRWRRWAPAAALFAVAPFATVVQPLTANVALASLLPTVLGWGAVLLALGFVHRGRWPLLAAAVPVLAAGILYQEYSIPPVLAAVVLLAGTGWRRSDPELRRRCVVAGAALLLTAALGYALFLASAGGTRDDVLPSHALGLERSAGWYLHGLGGGLWRAWVAAPAAAIGALPGSSAPALGLGLVVGLLLAAALARGHREQAEADRSGGLPELLLATVVALAPVVLMGRIPWDPGDGMTSRYGLPVLPLIGALIVRSLLVLRDRRWATAAAALLAVAAGSATVRQAREAVAERRLVADLGDALLPRAEANDAATIAVVPLPARTLGPRRQWELVARLAADWPAPVRRRLWAYRYDGGPPLDYREEARVAIGERGRCRPPRRIRKHIRGVVRRGPVAAVTWVEPAPSGARIEPYCARATGG